MNPAITILRIFFLALTAMLLASCASTPIPTTEEPQNELAMIDTSWQSGNATHPAVADLLREADRLREQGRLEQASDKVERALRIEPFHAPGWSRLSLLALESGQPGRAIRMARKSNSHAGNATRLKQQNWEYIRQASLQLDDMQGVADAERQITRLQDSQ